MHELGHFLVIEWWSRVEDKTIQRALGDVDPVENERVEVDVQIERGAKPLNDVDGSCPGVGNAVVLGTSAVVGGKELRAGRR